MTLNISVPNATQELRPKITVRAGPFLATLFDRSVRIGKPIGLVGMADATRGPAFAATAGLLRFSSVEHEMEPRLNKRGASRQNLFWRIGEWFNTHL